MEYILVIILSFLLWGACAFGTYHIGQQLCCAKIQEAVPLDLIPENVDVYSLNGSRVEI